ncbi:hypothetical protein G7Y89_g4784 [Cudoniella acicularis]|uniref:3-beta hydroxysteroid dehydrogenase/isomerase domain-containing protein n=1 Tax=Cudoniella acicularis TaxID=354080 RepID=A0A8H4RPJ7_9HELO|nr:hypothetical protein G7Y89_g4784 [Cudoniella acicularis]
MTDTTDTKLGTVLVTGGNGIVGSHVVDAFLTDGTFTRVVATQHRNQQYQNPKAHYLVCDITDAVQVTDLLNEVQPQVIVHTVSPGPFAPPKAQHRVNYIATKQLLETAYQSNWVQAFVYTSSVEAVVLSGIKSKQETEEDAVLNDLTSGPSAYARTKGATDALVLSFNTPVSHTNVKNPDVKFQNTLLTSSLRIGALYGERDETTIAKLLKLVNTFGARVQVGSNKAVHDWVYTESAARAHVLASKALLDSHRQLKEVKVDGEAFFITDGNPMLFWDFSRKVLTQAGDRKLNGETPVKIIQIPFGVMLFFASIGELSYKVFTLGYKSPKMARHHFDFMRKGCWFSIEKARVRLGYRPVCDTDEGIRRSVKWFQEVQSDIIREVTKAKQHR